MRKSCTKLDLAPIENLTNKRVTLFKRKRGILKKAIELSVLCGLNVTILL